MSDTHMLKQGTVLAQRYTIVKALGRGGMGTVYLASMAALGGKRVAIKEMELQGTSPDQLEAALRQFQTEGSLLANLDHPNLVPVTDFFTERQRYYLVMAYVPGETLQQKLHVRGKGFEWFQVREWAATLCQVLHYLHTQNPPILFRDLKPSNIMVDDSGVLKLIDFGIARHGDAGSKTSTFLQGTGTSGYSPIEQYGGPGSTDPRSDVYSLGATLYTLLTGLVPPDAVSRVSGQSVKPPSLVSAALPHSVDALILKALAQLPKDRFQTMEEMGRSLGVSAPVVKPPLPPEAMDGGERAPARITLEVFPTQLQPRQKTSTWVLAIASLVAACLVLVAAISLKPEPDAEKSTRTARAEVRATPALPLASLAAASSQRSAETPVTVNLRKPPVTSKTSKRLTPKTQEQSTVQTKPVVSVRPSAQPPAPSYPKAQALVPQPVAEKPAAFLDREVAIETAEPIKPRVAIPPRPSTTSRAPAAGLPRSLPQGHPKPRPGFGPPDAEWGPPGRDDEGHGGPMGRAPTTRRKSQQGSIW